MLCVRRSVFDVLATFKTQIKRVNAAEGCGGSTLCVTPAKTEVAVIEYEAGYGGTCACCTVGVYRWSDQKLCRVVSRKTLLCWHWGCTCVLAVYCILFLFHPYRTEKCCLPHNTINRCYLNFCLLLEHRILGPQRKIHRRKHHKHLVCSPVVILCSQ